MYITSASELESNIALRFTCMTAFHLNSVESKQLASENAIFYEPVELLSSA